MWLRDCWQVAAYSDEVGSSLLPRRLLDEAVVLYRTPEHTVVALADRCAHRGLPLSMGRLLGDTVRCGYHGMCFSSDGRAVSVPGQDTLPDHIAVRRYPVTERYRIVWIWMGAPELADPALVPDVHFYTDPAWAAVYSYLHVDADYRLLVDNLLDLSHETFVHPTTLGNDAVAETPVTARIVDGTAQAHRFMKDVEPPGIVIGAAGVTENIDRWATSIYSPPGYCLIESGHQLTGNPEKRWDLWVVNFMTPETVTSTHYFWGVARSYSLHDKLVDEIFHERVTTTFNEDKIILEAQQRAIGPIDDPLSATIKVDAGPVLGRRLLQAALDKERSGDLATALRS